MSVFNKIFGSKETKVESDKDVTFITNEQGSEPDSSTISNVKVELIEPNRYQPRYVFNDEKIAELAATIAVHGIIQPIVVRETGDGRYEIIAGERRFRAASSLGWEEVPVIINNLNDGDTASIALIENLQREELSPIEEAVAFAKLLQLHDITQEELAISVGVSQSTVANKLRLLKLPEKVQEAVLEKIISERHARALLPLKVADLQITVLGQVISRNLNVKQTEQLVQKTLDSKTGDTEKKVTRKIISKDVRIAMNTLKQSITMINNHGIDLETEEEDFENFYQVTIKIPK